MATSTTYSDLIEDKVKEWKKTILFQEEQAKHAPKSIQAEIKWKNSQLLAAIDNAANKLEDLNNNENNSNTLIIKKEILQIFDSIDRDLKDYEFSSPFML